ncbi:MAG: hypothetical protein IT429_05525 [Gemmataceae bacterium]|nr:hypothetical protein [Gemmataceae bacterium]
MRNLFRYGGPPLLAAVILVFAFAGTFYAQVGGPDAAPGDAKDRKIREALRIVIEQGRSLHNRPNFDYVGCYRVFQGGLTAVQPLLDHHPDLQRAIADGLAKAEALPPNQRGFALREVIDRIRARLGGAAGPGQDKTPADKGVRPMDKEMKDRKEPDKRPPLDGTKDLPPRKDRPVVPGDGEKKDDKGPGPGVKTPDVGTLTGKVMYKGKSLTSGYVTLLGHDGRKYSASIRPDGTYAFQKVTLPLDEYTVTIEPEPALVGRPGTVMLPQVYRDVTTSPLRATVRRGANSADLQLE